MTNELALLESAARCYEQAGEPAEAARVRERTGALTAAARLYEKAGMTADAARCYRTARLPEEAARCHLLLGQVESAADCVEAAGDPLTAAWLLACVGRRPRRARWSLASVRPLTLDQRLRLEVCAGLCVALESGDSTALATAADAAVGQLSEVGAGERERLVRWVVGCADAAGRADLAAAAHARAFRDGVPGALGRWHRWAGPALGGTTWLPGADGAAHGGRDRE
ncbi:hypothetical protein [Streptomyces sp. NPDC086182]|uniref:hypothetical protein n=1 Tax=Streptomyces sp. NPDC086182 TaxID=3155058 RepID=UPI00343DFA06